MKRAKELNVGVERWPIRGGFTISRGSKREAVVVVATIRDGAHQGRGECVPYARYGEDVDGVVLATEAFGPRIAQGLDRAELQSLLPPGAARNALDCALWDLEAKMLDTSAAEIAGLAPLHAVETALTISLASPEEMAARAQAAAHYPLLKLKLGGDGDEERLAAVRQAVPKARLIVDANEAWDASNLERLLAVAKVTGIELIEQPLPAGDDALLQHIARVVPLCADESVHDRASLRDIAKRYDAVNIKLDKTGGLTEALATSADARRLGLKIMVGCMVATSLAMAPALLLAQDADWVDLDGPLLLERDRVPGLTYSSGTVMPAPAALWG
ncbi:N-acetyl-D-Glu racemase DgcA [Methyloceanibacter sp.]|uniref:N-acetyl-D-Glu racemase DgcA n=1 Tax=Methyloceanibacter sp. TaxID=1965321 RepID=UPI003D6D0E08